MLLFSQTSTVTCRNANNIKNNKNASLENKIISRQVERGNTKEELEREVNNSY